MDSIKPKPGDNTDIDEFIQSMNEHGLPTEVDGWFEFFTECCELGRGELISRYGDLVDSAIETTIPASSQVVAEDNPLVTIVLMAQLASQPNVRELIHLIFYFAIGLSIKEEIC